MSNKVGGRLGSKAADVTSGGLSRAPSNARTIVTNALVSALEVTDLRYSLICYGGFVKDIPRRLGTNDALDASVGALTSAFSSLQRRRQSPETLSRYVHALKTLRISLNDPAKAHSPNTLCAMYLIMICQVSLVSSSSSNKLNVDTAGRVG